MLNECIYAKFTNSIRADTHNTHKTKGSDDNKVSKRRMQQIRKCSSFYVRTYVVYSFVHSSDVVSNSQRMFFWNDHGCMRVSALERLIIILAIYGAYKLSQTHTHTQGQMLMSALQPTACSSASLSCARIPRTMASRPPAALTPILSSSLDENSLRNMHPRRCIFARSWCARIAFTTARSPPAWRTASALAALCAQSAIKARHADSCRVALRA